MLLKVIFLLSLYIFKTSCLSVRFEDGYSDKEILDINEHLMKNFEWDFNHQHIKDSSESNEDTSEEHIDEAFDSWSLVWYIASFGGLIAFFLVVSCSEWCCRKHAREQQSRAGLTSSPLPSPTTESPPPDYDLFAPPSYESLNNAAAPEKSEYDVYVVPVHAIGTLVNDGNQIRQEEDPPSYNSVSQQHTNNQRTPDV